MDTENRITSLVISISAYFGVIVNFFFKKIKKLQNDFNTQFAL